MSDAGTSPRRTVRPDCQASITSVACAASVSVIRIAQSPRRYPSSRTIPRPSHRAQSHGSVSPVEQSGQGTYPVGMPPVALRLPTGFGTGTIRRRSYESRCSARRTCSWKYATAIAARWLRISSSVSRILVRTTPATGSVSISTGASISSGSPLHRHASRFRPVRLPACASPRFPII
jgi:hypothetical protein